MMHMHSLVLAALTAATALAAAHEAKKGPLSWFPYRPAPGWGGKFKTLFAFGDSYTDEARLSYFISHNGSAPPVGWIGPDSDSAASGGHSWARYVNYYTGAKLFNYAVSGAVCSNEITPRWLSSIRQDFPSVKEYEVPALKKDLEAWKFLVDWSTAVVSMWIGTNDLGGAALLDHAQVRGKTLVDYTSCVFSQLGELYHLGARRFVLLNIAPLELAPLYSVLGTPGPDRFWLEKGYNLTDIAASMTEEVAAANEIFSLHAQLAVKNELWGSKIAILNTNGLIRDIYNHPELYLNGTAPLNVTGYNVHCGVAGNCFDYRIDDRDAFLWYDALHPSEQASRVVAREFKATVEGKGKWATYW